VEPINQGEICCIGFGDISEMKDFDKLLDRTYCLELDDDWFFNAIRFLTEDNTGVFINDCFDDEGYNVEGICLRLGDKWSRQFEVKALRIIMPDEELYIKYGREYWCYRLHFESLTEEQQMKCSFFYEIDKDSELVDVVVEDTVPTAVIQSPKGKGKGKGKNVSK